MSLRCFQIWGFVFAIAIALYLNSAASAQPQINQKLLDAKAAYNEAVRLRDEGNFKSYQAALKQFELSARLYAEGGDRGNYASSLLGIGFIQNLLDDNDAALKNYNAALKIFQELNLIQLEARTINNIGRIYDDRGEKQRALEYQFYALPLRRLAKDRHGEGSTLNSIAAVYSDLGDRQKALSYYADALAIRQELKAPGEIAVTLNNIGMVYSSLGDQSKAIQYLSQSLTFRRAAGDKTGEAITLNNLGMASESPTVAIGYYQQAIAILTDIGIENLKGSILNNIGASYLDLKEPKKTIEFARQAIPRHTASGNQGGVASALNNIARANLDLGNTRVAMTDLNSALAAAQASQEKELEASILGNMMYAAKTSGQTPSAIFYGKQAINKYQELRRSIAGLDPEIQKTYLRTKENNYRQLAELLIESGAFAAAERVLRLLKEEEYFEFVRRDEREIKSLSQRVTLSAKEDETLKRYATLSDSVAAIGREFSVLDEKKRRLSRIGQTLLTEDQSRYDTLAEQLSKANAAFKLFLDTQLREELGRTETKKIESDRDLQVRLGKWGNGTVALYTIVTEERYRVILTTPTVQIDGKTEIKAVDLNKKIFAFRDALLDRSVDPRPLGKELYDILLKPIEKHLNGAGAKTLLWSLDGALRYVPLAALSPDGKTYLAEKYASSILTLKTRDDLADNNAEWRALGVGISDAVTITDPTDDKKKVEYVALPDAKKELLGVVRDERLTNENGILSGRRFLDKDFTRANFRDSLSLENTDGKRKFNVVHIASHFTLGDDWGSSYLVLGDGNILTLEQISTAPDITFDEVELVTLSACNTAFTNYSNGREVDSLAEAIQTKSGKAVLATLWAIADVSTSPMMSKFYKLRNDIARKVTKTEAIQSAQKAMISGQIKLDATETKKLKPKAAKPNATAFVFDESKPFAHPYYWSPFVLIGNWR